MPSGRPPKPFQEACARTKKRRTQKLRTEMPTEQLTFAAQMNLKAEKHGSKIVKDVTSNTGRATKYRKTFHTLQNKTEKLTPAESPSIFVKAGLTRNQYENVQSGAKSIYPCYSIIQKAQKEFYPSKNSYQVTQTSVEINLQAVARLHSYTTC
ncbi:hypothetical protein AVEN_228441-1 [Araneus ventricosus]|uniref:Uncharacterized protein n=1 Tax=Araneus ventricosus TaxID=182803 RepID=A0A4Y2K734_ARAVE|nr:hypothetical protein AVEN_228441-1 [Araneus ventricosus]